MILGKYPSTPGGAGRRPTQTAELNDTPRRIDAAGSRSRARDRLPASATSGTHGRRAETGVGVSNLVTFTGASLSQRCQWGTVS